MYDNKYEIEHVEYEKIRTNCHVIQIEVQHQKWRIKNSLWRHQRINNTFVDMR